MWPGNFFPLSPLEIEMEHWGKHWESESSIDDAVEYKLINTLYK